MNNEICEHNFFGDGCPKCQERRIIMGITIQVDTLTEKQAKDYLKKLIEWLDDLDGEDFFGTEGWRQFGGFD